MCSVNVVDGNTFVITEMPSSTLGFSVIISLSVSVLLPGIYFFNKFWKRIGRKRVQKWKCPLCGLYLRCPGFNLKNGQYMKCNIESCRGSSPLHNTDSSRMCQSCTLKVTSWIDETFRIVQPLKKDLPLIGESPYSAHTALLDIIRKIVSEANQLPKFKGEEQTIALERNNRTYHDFVSTAISNKMISSSQNSLHLDSASSSRTNSLNSHESSSSWRRKNQKEYFFASETLDHKWRNIDADEASTSSLEDWVHSDSIFHSTIPIKQRIEEDISEDTDQEREDENLHNDEVYFSPSKCSLSDDESNWSLKKMHFGGNYRSPAPVLMLVPNPISETKIRIGDKEIDETSDLSDPPSDFEIQEEDDDYFGPMNIYNHFIQSKCLIGGHNFLVDIGQHTGEDVPPASRVNQSKHLEEIDSQITSSGRGSENYESVNSDSSIEEKDSEYTERYATLPKTILISPEEKRLSNEYSHQDRRELDQIELDEDQKIDEENITFPGIYSQREKEKWKHAVELKNNPYSKENMERRISKNSMFSRENLVRQACFPSGAKKSDIGSEMPLEELEENYTYTRFPRSLYSPKESSKNFVKNPLLNFPESVNSL